MKDIFHDKEFGSFLEGGVDDLEEPIGSLIYHIWQRQLIKTFWSSAGHINDYHVGMSSRLKTHFCYQSGFIFFYPIDNKISLDFMNQARDFTLKHSFGRWIEPRPEAIDYHQIILEMEDIADKVTLAGYSIPQLEVRKPLAKKRLKEFYKFWEDLDKLVLTQF